VIEDVEGPLRAWLRAQPDLATFTASHIYFSAPDTTDRPDCWLTLRRIGGGLNQGDLMEDQPLISFGCWGRSRQKAAELAALLVDVLVHDLNRPVEMPPLTALGAQVTLWSYEPDLEVPVPRYVVDAIIHFTATVAV
jgi:hypothetical protein